MEDSGVGSTPMQPEGFPPALDRFSWPAFLLSWIWYLAHGLWLPGVLLLVVPLAVGAALIAFYGVHSVDPMYLVLRWLLRDVLFLSMAMLFAWRANRMAWAKAGVSFDLETFQRRQRKWEKWAVAVLMLYFAVVGAALAYVSTTISALAQVLGRGGL